MAIATIPAVEGLQVHAPVSPAGQEILSPEALAFAGTLLKEFRGRRAEIFQRRQRVQAQLDAAGQPHFLEETKSIREGNWKTAPIPKDLLDRRVEITSPVDRKMIINALNAGAKMFM